MHVQVIEQLERRLLLRAISSPAAHALNAA
jgi:hypothetical protein